MGVSHLWDILETVKVGKALDALRNQRLAVDLAFWICEAESLAKMRGISKPYLRNLFFRIKALTRYDVRLIFVIDGKPPEIKWNTISKRLGGKSVSGSRTRLNAKFKQCCDLLNQLGIPWVKADGEAEALCAHLNATSFVDACLTNDSDSFLYGANVVYRNFSSDDQAETAIESYSAEDIERKLGLTRNSLIALALLLGCDYAEKGIPGVGKVQAVELLRNWKGDNPLEKLRRLTGESRPLILDDVKPSHCSFCKHAGRKAEHAKALCPVCKESCKIGIKSDERCTCSWHEREDDRMVATLEENIRGRAKKVASFPNEAIIAEFTRVQKLPSKSLDDKHPSLRGVVAILTEQLGWTREDCITKTLPVLTSWTLRNFAHDPAKALALAEPQRVVKERKRQGVPLYEVIWRISDLDDGRVSVTLERQDLFAQTFPELVSAYNDVKRQQKIPKNGSKDLPTTKITDFFPKKKQRATKAKAGIKKTPVKREKGSRDDDVLYVGHVSPSKREKPTAGEEATTIRKNLFGGQTTRTADDVTTTDCLVGNAAVEDISFGLNFSLGSSLLKTPQTAAAAVNSSLMSASDSPFMTIKERLKLEKS